MRDRSHLSEQAAAEAELRSTRVDAIRLAIAGMPNSEACKLLCSALIECAANIPKNDQTTSLDEIQYLLTTLILEMINLLRPHEKDGSWFETEH